MFFNFFCVSSCFHICIVFALICVCCVAVFNNANLPSMVCIGSIEYNYRRLHWFMVIHSRLNRKSPNNNFYLLKKINIIKWIFIFFTGHFKLGNNCIGWQLSSETIPRDLLLFSWHIICLRNYSSCLRHYMVTFIEIKAVLFH